MLTAQIFSNENEFFSNTKVICDSFDVIRYYSGEKRGNTEGTIQ